MTKYINQMYMNGYDNGKNAVDDEVIAWQQIPGPYKERGSRWE